MIPRRKTSRKRSAASSSAKPLESAVFYLDESIYSRILSEEMERAVAAVRRPGVDIPFGTSDADWLATARETAVVVVAKLAKMLNISRSERRPFLYTLGMTGRLSKLKIRRRVSNTE